MPSLMALIRSTNKDSVLPKILNASRSEVLAYHNEIKPLLRGNEQLYAEFLLKSGLRVSAGIAISIQHQAIRPEETCVF